MSQILKSMDIGKVCRSCLDSNGPFQSIYDATAKSRMVFFFITNITRIEPNRCDRMPDNVCLSCVSEIEYCSSFWSKCVKSDQTLRKLLLDSVEEEPDPNDMLEIKVEQTESTTVPFQASKDESVREDVQAENSIAKQYYFVREIDEFQIKNEAEKDMLVCGQEEFPPEDEMVLKTMSEDEKMDETGESSATNVDNAKKPVQCKFCNKSFATNSGLKRHNCMPSGAKPIKCDQCNSSFTQLVNLKTHMRIHTGVKPFACDLCSKSFTQQSHLKNHIRVHTGVKSVHCDMCSKSFTQKSSLKNHMRIHTGERPFECHLCNKSFTQQSNLKEHLRIHTGIKPFQCDMCDKSFTQQSHLNDHMRVHAGVKPFQCTQCNKSFTQKINLKSHMRHHNVDKPQAAEVLTKLDAEQEAAPTEQQLQS